VFVRIPYYCYCVGHWFHKWGVPFLPALCTAFNRIVFAAWIPSSAEIGRSTFGRRGLVWSSIATRRSATVASSAVG